MIVGNVEAGYLFLVFNVESLRYSPPCSPPNVCREDAEMLGLGQMPEPESLLWSSTGFSRQALIEIASPLINIFRGHEDGKEWLGDRLYTEINCHYKIYLAGVCIDILPDRILSEVAAEDSGEVRQGLKYRPKIN